MKIKCFFGHKFGSVQSDGWQYCGMCGKATKPNPCIHGHIWKEVKRYSYIWKKPGTEIVYKNDDQIAYQCSGCGKTKSEWLFGVGGE